MSIFFSIVKIVQKSTCWICAKPLTITVLTFNLSLLNLGIIDGFIGNGEKCNGMIYCPSIHLSCHFIPKPPALLPHEESEMRIVLWWRRGFHELSSSWAIHWNFPTQVRASKPYKVSSLSYPPTITGFNKLAKSQDILQLWYINPKYWFNNGFGYNVIYMLLYMIKVITGKCKDRMMIE